MQEHIRDCYKGKYNDFPALVFSPSWAPQSCYILEGAFAILGFWRVWAIEEETTAIVLLFDSWHLCLSLSTPFLPSRREDAKTMLDKGKCWTVKKGVQHSGLCFCSRACGWLIPLARKKETVDFSHSWLGKWLHLLSMSEGWSNLKFSLLLLYKQL